jgi:indolepyruvate ferredoxin oxidoreductase beta subunit
MPTEARNILICGTGGQGILLASEIISAAAMHSGLDVRKSEVHGMAQRGGSVVSQVRFGKTVFSPIIEEGTADLLISMEKLEALRWSHFLSPEGHALICNLEIEPSSVGAPASYTEFGPPDRMIARTPRASSSDRGVSWGRSSE